MKHDTTHRNRCRAPAPPRTRRGVARPWRIADDHRAHPRRSAQYRSPLAANGPTSRSRRTAPSRPTPTPVRRAVDPPGATPPRGAVAHGWHNDLWTAARVAKLIRDCFGVAFHPEHVRRILKEKLNWSSQRPRLRARERDDAEVERWRTEELPRLVRRARQRGVHLVFLDEAGFQLTPVVRRTFAPRGRTPVLTAPLRRKKISAISCVTLSPRRGRAGLFFRLLDEGANARASDVVVFLKQLRRQLRGGFIVVWDRSNIHSRSHLVKAWLARHPEGEAADFPGYAPELNPDELVWSWTKYSELCNLAPRDVEELRDWVEDALLDLADRPPLLKSFVEHVIPLSQAA